MARSSTSARHSGFTLVEVLIALAVLAIALAAVMRVLAQSIDLSASLRDRTIAFGVAQDQLVLHYARRDWPDPDTRTGTREQAGRLWRWQEKVITTDLPEFRRIEIDVSDANEQRLAHLIGYLRKPTTQQQAQSPQPNQSGGSAQSGSTL